MIFFFSAFSMDTIVSEQKCEQKNGKTTLYIAFSAKTKVVLTAAAQKRKSVVIECKSLP